MSDTQHQTPAQGAPQPPTQTGGAPVDGSAPMLKTSEKVSYGFGDLGVGFMFDLGQAYLSKFYTDVALIAPGLVTVIFTVTKIFDAFMDPIAGPIIDARKRKPGEGKFRRWLMPAACVLAVLTVLTFTTIDAPMWAKFAFALATYCAWGACYPFLCTPFVAMASVMTRNSVERTQLATCRQVGSLGGQLITGVTFIPIILFFSGGTLGAHGYIIAAAIMSVCGIAAIFVVRRGTKEHLVSDAQVSKPREKGALKTYAKVVFTNRPLGAVVLMCLCTISAMNANNTMMVYFCEYNLHNVGLQPLVNGIMIGVSILGILSMPMLTRKFGKKNTVIACLVIGAAANALNFVIPTNVPTFIVLVTIGYTALAIPNGVLWAFVADATDYGEWHTGVRLEGTTTASVNFSRKAAQTLAAMISTGLLAVTGYVANQAQSAATLLGIKGVMTLYPACALLLAAVVIFFLYNLDEKTYEKISDDLANGRWEHGKIGEEA